jgi:glucose-6-phosphate isomerase
MRLVATLAAKGEAGATCEQLAAELAPDDPATVFSILEHLAANPGRGIARVPRATPFDAIYRWTG